MVQGLYTRVGSEHSLIPCGVLGGTILEPNLRGSLMKSNQIFSRPELSTWSDWAHLLDNEHLYFRSIKGSFSSLYSPSRTWGPKIKPHHFTCEKVGSAKVDKVGLDWGHNCTWIGPMLGPAPSRVTTCHPPILSQHNNEGREGIIVCERTSHPSTKNSTPISLLLVHSKWSWVNEFVVFKASSGIKSTLKKQPPDCILIHGFYVGWMRGKLVYDSSLSPQWRLEAGADGWMRRAW